MCAHHYVSGCLTKQRSSENLRCVRRCTLRCSSAWDLHALRLSIRKETALTPPLASTNWRGRAIYYLVRLGRLIWQQARITTSYGNSLRLIERLLLYCTIDVPSPTIMSPTCMYHARLGPEASRTIIESHSFQSPAHNRILYQRANRSIVPQSSIGPLRV